MEIDHEIFSTVILSLPLIQEGQLSVSGKKNVHNTAGLQAKPIKPIITYNFVSNL